MFNVFEAHETDAFSSWPRVWIMQTVGASQLWRELNILAKTECTEEWLIVDAAVKCIKRHVMENVCYMHHTT